VSQFARIPAEPHIQEISGHRALAALERYLGVTEKQKQNAISALDFLKMYGNSRFTECKKVFKN
jgi:hypothetical protein